MVTGSDYFLSWGIYLIAVCGAHCVLWRMLRRVNSQDLRIILHMSLLAVLITPAPLDPDSSYWVPAYMVATMEGLNEGMEAFFNRLIPILIVMLALVSVSLVFNLLRRRAASA